MNLTKHIAKHLRDVHFGGNWTTSNFRDQLKGLTWKQVTTKIADLNTIATLTYHATYYVEALKNVLDGQPLNAKDEFSFKQPPITSQEEWEDLLNKAWANAENAAQLIELMPDEKLLENFTDEKYGNYYRNIAGTIEHLHYHLGQIVVIKKMIMQNS